MNRTEDMNQTIKQKITEIKATNNLELFQALCKIMREHIGKFGFDEFWKEVIKTHVPTEKSERRRGSRAG